MKKMVKSAAKKMMSGGGAKKSGVKKMQNGDLQNVQSVNIDDLIEELLRLKDQDIKESVRNNPSNRPKIRVRKPGVKEHLIHWTDKGVKPEDLLYWPDKQQPIEYYKQGGKTTKKMKSGGKVTSYGKKKSAKKMQTGGVTTANPVKKKTNPVDRTSGRIPQITDSWSGAPSFTNDKGSKILKKKSGGTVKKTMKKKSY